MKPLAAWDLEIANDIDPGRDWKEQGMLGISCAAVAFEGDDGIQFWHNGDLDPLKSAAMEPVEVMKMTIDLMEIAKDYTLVTWNGASFDFYVLAQESAMYKACADLAYNHIDLMALVVATRGHFLGLQAASKGMGLVGKRKQVTLSTGEVVEDMSGAMAPELWRKGEYEPVLNYLADDVRATLELAKAVRNDRELRWVSSRGYKNTIPMPKLYTVKQSLGISRAVPSWVTEPKHPRELISWTS